MRLDHFPTINFKAKDLDKILANGSNLLLCGPHGCGKTQRVLDCFQRNNLKYVYFSGSTLDPWIDLIGIPKEGEDGSLNFLRPSKMSQDLEAIFIDEYNRCDKAVKNALMELIQFRSINGVSFPNLKVIWAAVNPPDDDDEDMTYQVEDIDPAQLDRFDVIANVPNQPNKDYFKKRFGDKGLNAVKWWENQSESAKKAVSARRLEKALKIMDSGIPVKCVLPKICNVSKFVMDVNTDPKQKAVMAFKENPTVERFKEIVNLGDIETMKQVFVPEYYDYSHMLPSDLITDKYLNNELYRKTVNTLALCNHGSFTELLEEIFKAYPDSDITKKYKKVKTVASMMPNFWKLEKSTPNADKNAATVDFNSIHYILKRTYTDTAHRDQFLNFCSKKYNKKKRIPFREDVAQFFIQLSKYQNNSIKKRKGQITDLISRLDPKYFEDKRCKDFLNICDKLFGLPQKSLAQTNLNKLMKKYTELEEL